MILYPGLLYTKPCFVTIFVFWRASLPKFRGHASKTVHAISMSRRLRQN